MGKIKFIILILSIIYLNTCFALDLNDVLGSYGNTIGDRCFVKIEATENQVLINYKDIDYTGRTCFEKIFTVSKSFFLKSLQEMHYDTVNILMDRNNSNDDIINISLEFDKDAHLQNITLSDLYIKGYGSPSLINRTCEFLVKH